MSATACSITLTQAGYPPVKNSLTDTATLKKIAALQAAAPFGRAPNGQAVTAIQYSTAMNRQIGAVKSIDFRWPFWVGLGLGGAGFAVLLLRHLRH